MTSAERYMFLVTVVLVPLCATAAPAPAIHDTIEKLFTTIQELQITEDSKLDPPFSWLEKKGSYRSDVRANFHGPEEFALIRELLSVPDTNMFTTAWVTSCLLEANIFGSAPKPSDSQLALALDVIDKFRDRNTPYNNSIMNFWPQTYNQTAQYYQSTPKNLVSVLSAPTKALPTKIVEELLKLLGLKDLERVLESVLQERAIFLQAFHIPPDFDDTFVNIGLGSLLSFFPNGARTWKAQNSNVSSVLAALKHYAYRPFDADGRINTIDPRTYYVTRQFLQDARSHGQDVALVSTWIQDTTEVRTLFEKGVAMPFNVNNVDLTVSANTIFGITLGVLRGIFDSEEDIDIEVKEIFLNTTKLIAHQISGNLSSRPDLALTYYPSKFEFYWFVSRTYSWLNRFLGHANPNTDNIPASVRQMFSTALTTLRPALQNAMSRDVISSTKVDDEGNIYVDDFLGDNDFDFRNKTLVRAEDRIFSTSVSVAALINTWTMYDCELKHLVWQNDTPKDVLSTVDGAIAWLNTNVFSEKYKPWNAFFSGSGKGLKSMPFPYPANFLEYFNGTRFNDTKYPTDLRNFIGFKGVVSVAEYDSMLSKPHFGMLTPRTFEGYNSEPGGFFPFWTSDAYTYSTALVALSHFENIKRD